MDKIYQKGRIVFSTETALGKFLATMLFSIFFSVTAIAQNIQVNGKVTDEKGEGLPGVSIQLKSGSKGAVTDIEGNYTLADVPSNGTLVFSFVGMSTQEQLVAGKSVLNVVLREDAALLEEVVVIGYGTQKVKDATGAIATMGSKDFNKGVINSPDQMLQGRVAGVQITPNSGDPGGGINIRIRGTTSLRGSNNPLYVVDGVPLDGGETTPGKGADDQTGGIGSTPPRNPLNFLNPADIENISILKDASAAAIYGSRGANGVVLITTKKGKPGAGQLNFSSSVSLATPAKTYDLLDRNGFLDQAKKAGLDLTSPFIDSRANTDWQNEIYRTALTQNYNMSFGGGTAKTSYYFSLGLQDQEGIIEGSNQDRFQARVNASHKLFDDRVTVGVNLTTAKINDRYSPISGDIGFEGNLIARSISTAPTLPIYNPNGGYYTTATPSFRNPVAMLNQLNIFGPTTRNLINPYVSWKIINNLTYKFNYGIDNTSSTLNQSVDIGAIGFYNTTNNGKGFAAIGDQTKLSTTIEHTLNYITDFGKSNLDLLGGFAYYLYQSSGNRVEASYFNSAPGFLTVNNIGFVDNVGSNKPFYGGSFKNRPDLQSFFGRGQYNYDEKYYLTLTLRIDGASKFGKNNKYGTFPAINGAWRITGENFFNKNGTLSDLKLRAGWGIAGNSEGFPPNQTIFTYIPDRNGGIQKENVANPDLKWERTESFNVGLDWALLKGRLSGTFDYFSKSTDDLLFASSAKQPEVAKIRWENLDADIRNQGLEIAVNYDILAGKKLSWDASVNGTFLNNKVKTLRLSSALTGNVYGQGLSDAYIQPITEGYPLYTFFVPEFLGFDENGNTKLGETRAFGSPLAKFTWGLTNNFNWGNWNASVFINGQNGGKIFNNTALALMGAPAIKQGNNSDTDWLDPKQSYSDGITPSSRFVDKSDFVRLSNLIIGYNFKLKSDYIKSLGLSFSGQNLFLISAYKGLDPEVSNISAAKDGVPSVGIDYISYPKNRTYTLGVNVSF